LPCCWGRTKKNDEMIIKPPTSNEVNRIADWVELHIITSNSSISKSKIISLLQKDGIGIDEEDVDSVITELERRLYLYGKIKPFNIDGTNISPNFNWKKFPEFTLCLYYSTYGVGKTKKGDKRDNGTKLFEDITKVCLENYLQSKGHLFGFPNPSPFKEQLNTFAKEINEKRFEDPNPHDKDRDVDLIIYKKLDEIRDNCILFFVQCAAGKNWDDKKAVPIESYRRYMSFSLKATIASLAITQVVDINDWRNACDDYGIIIDRARLYQILSGKKTIIPKKLSTEIVNWCNTKLN
jgi:hypothetical protein